MPGIEFVDPDSDAGPDEELAAGPRRQWAPRTKRAVRIGAAGVLTLVAGSVLVGALRGGGGGTTDAASPAGLAPVLAPEAPSGAFRVDHLGAEAPEGARAGTLAGRTPSAAAESSTVAIPIDCPVVDACDVDLTFPAAVRAALRARLPGVRRLTGGAVVVRGHHPTLRSRQLAAQDGRLSVRVDIEPAGSGAHARSSSSTVGAGTTVSATAVVRGFTVTVTVSGPDTRAPGLATVRALAADRRLLTVV